MGTRQLKGKDPLNSLNPDVVFSIDEESPNESHSYTSSQTESLLGRATSPTIEPPTDREEDETETDEKDGGHDDASRQFAIRIPTPDEIDMALRRKRRRIPHVNMVVLGLVALFGSAWLITNLLALGTRFGHGGPKISVILMISDGMGPASETFSRSFLQYMHDQQDPLTGKSLLNGSVWSGLDSGFMGSSLLKGFGTTPLDEMLVGTSRTRSSNSLVTDSAAGATAFASGVHTYNGAIGVMPDKSPVGTVLEAAKRQGFATGLVATSRITHATPASFYAHVVDRDLESEIATFLIGSGPRGQVVDIALGGGLCFFLPNTTQGSCRTDDQDLLAMAEKKGIKVLQGQKELDNWHESDGHEGTDQVLGLFASGHMEYEIDRQQIADVQAVQPSLKSMAMHALQHLQKDPGKGFFLMIEGSRIDMAAQYVDPSSPFLRFPPKLILLGGENSNNDPVGHLSDILAYHDMVRYVKQWVDKANKDGDRTMLISISDHETGGLALGRQLTNAYPEYAWYPDALANATHSTSYLGTLLAENANPTTDWIREELFSKGLGITDVSTSEVNEVWNRRTNAHQANLALADSISRRAQVGWSTEGHSGVDVNLYGYGYNSTGLTGNIENIEIGEHIAHNMGLNLEVITIELNKNLNWFASTAGKSAKRTTTLQHYHGDF